MHDEIDKKKIIEAAIFAAGEPVTLERLIQLFPEDDQVSKADMKTLLAQIEEAYEARGVELVQVASGYRFQAKQECAPWLQRLWEKKPTRYTRAFLETLVLIAYRQPITRGEIEEVRGVVVSSNIMRQLLEREWVKIVGYKDVPGKPALFSTTKQFLDYFSLQSLSDLPELQDMLDLDEVEKQLGTQLNLEVSAPADVPPQTDNVLVLETETDSVATVEEEVDEVIMDEIDKLIESVG